MTNERIGAALRDVRRKRKMNQWELAELLGITQANVSQLESGTHGLSVVRLLDVLRVLDVKPAAFFRIIETA